MINTSISSTLPSANKYAISPYRKTVCQPYLKTLWLTIHTLLFVIVLGTIPQVSAENILVYGRIDAGINYQSNLYSQNNHGNQWSIGGNQWGTSIFGIKANENLGQQLTAFFILENGFDASNGQVNGGSGLWTRRSLVGLQSPFGTVKLGRDLALPSDRVWSIDPTGQQAISSATLVKGRNWPQTNNQIQYITPDMGGFYLHGMYGLGEAAGSFTQGPAGANIGNSTGIAIGYAQPNYELLAMYDTARAQNGNYNDLFLYSKELTIGASVTINKAKLFAAYQNLSAPAAPLGPTTAQHFWIGTNYQFNPSLTLIAAVYHIRLNHDTGSATLLMTGANYYLSKRTLLYVDVGTIRNNAHTSFQIETGDTVPGQKQHALYAGISHSF